MAEGWTCGKGLAANAPLLTAMAEMISALAEILDGHTRSLNLTDGDSRTEYAAYASLVAQQRMIATALQSLADEMVSYESLPMGIHDMGVLMSPELEETFERLITSERALLQRLTNTVAEHEEMREASE